MQTILTVNTCEQVIKKSRFIGVTLPCVSTAEVNQLLQLQHQQHPNASHITYAYRLLTPKGMLCRFNDAGEPSGTAGKPIFKHLQGKDLINVVVAVIRYFGGVKLGAGGLTRAYGNAAKQVLEASEIVAFIQRKEFSLVLEYKQMQAFKYLLQKLDGEILQQQFVTQIHLLISLPESNSQQLLAAFPEMQSQQLHE